MNLFNFKNTISLEQINILRKDGKIIIISNNKVYDLTSYVNSHPGGKMTIIKSQEKDNSDIFNYHSQYAKKNWKKFKIGYLKKN